MLAEYLDSVKDRASQDSRKRSRTVEELVMRLVVDGDVEAKGELTEKLLNHLTGPEWPAVTAAPAQPVPPPSAAPPRPAVPRALAGTTPAEPIVESEQGTHDEFDLAHKTSRNLPHDEFEDKRAREPARHLPEIPDDAGPS